MSKLTTIRFAIKNDMSAVLGLINELAIYEKAANEVEVTVEELQKDGFGANPLFKCLVAEKEGIIIGIALYFFKYSTWKGKCIHLEDIVIARSERRNGIGSLLIEEVIRISKKEQVKRLEWVVLAWNTPAIEFYKKYNTNFDEEWISCKLVESQLK